MNRLLAVGGIAVLLLGFVMLVLPVSSIPLLDAKRQVLAETDAAGHCAGEVLVQTSGKGSEEAMQGCIESSSRSKAINHAAVQSAFCRGITSKVPTLDFTRCLEQVTAQLIWPTMKGTWTNAWNRRFPYPLDSFGVPTQDTGNESRTGDRDSNDREGNVRGE